MSADGRDGPGPVDTPPASPAGARTLAWSALACAALAVPTGLAVLVGPLGMALGAVAHVKGARLGMPAAVLAGVATVAGMAVQLYLR